MENDLKIAIVGDVLVTHRLPNNKQLEEISSLFKEHHCVIGNLETVVRKDEGYPEAFPGGGSCFCHPGSLSDLKKMGFNLFSTGNNHSMDYGHGGLLATLKYLDDYDLCHAGTGKNLSEASKAAHYDTPVGRIALISVTSSFHDSYLAGPQNQEVCGRPGVAPLRHKAIYSLPHDDYMTLSKIAELSGINSYHNQAIKEGYLKGSSYLKFGTFEFEEGGDYKVSTTPLNFDLRRTTDIIQDAKLESDVVILSVHSHQFINEKRFSPQFIEIFSRECIKAGADIVFCHGPHLLRGIETFEQGIIFYGLGDFILQHEGMEYMPEEAYIKQGLSRSTTKGVQHLLLERNHHGTKGLVASRDAWESVIVSLTISDVDISVNLYPITLMQNGIKGFKGIPYLSQDRRIIENICLLSNKYQTCISIDKKNTGFFKVNR